MPTIININIQLILHVFIKYLLSTIRSSYFVLRKVYGWISLTVVTPGTPSPGTHHLLSVELVQGMVPLGLTSGYVVVEPSLQGLIKTAEGGILMSVSYHQKSIKLIYVKN